MVFLIRAHSPKDPPTCFFIFIIVHRARGPLSHRPGGAVPRLRKALRAVHRSGEALRCPRPNRSPNHRTIGDSSPQHAANMAMPVPCIPPSCRCVGLLTAVSSRFYFLFNPLLSVCCFHCSSFPPSNPHQTHLLSLHITKAYTSWLH